MMSLKCDELPRANEKHVAEYFTAQQENNSSLFLALDFQMSFS